VGICPSRGTLKTKELKTFRKLDLFTSSRDRQKRVSISLPSPENGNCCVF
jgi:hypothetical protein